MADAVGTTHEIQLDGKFFKVRPGSYTKSDSPAPSAPQTPGKQLDLTPNKSWFQDSWVGGLGQDYWQDEAMYKDGFVDSYSHPHRLQCLQGAAALTNSVAWTGTTDTWPKMHVRQISSSDRPRLYVGIARQGTQGGDIYRFRDDLNSGQLFRLNALAQRVLAIGLRAQTYLTFSLDNGALQEYANGLETLGANYKVWANSQNCYAISNFNNGRYYGTGRGTVPAKVFREPPTTIDEFFNTDSMIVQGFAVWNSRLWFITNVWEGKSRLYVTDGTVVNQAYEWDSSFAATSIYSHWGHLYIGGHRAKYDESAGIAQVWKYNGATMDLIAQFDDSGLTNTPTFPSASLHQIWALMGWGKFLAVSAHRRTHTDGTARQGFWLYDPEEDSWHYGGYVLTADVDTNFAGIITALQDYDGRLFIGSRNTGKIHYVKNDATAFTKSQYLSSIFDGGIPNARKAFHRVTLKTTSKKYTRATVEYSVDEGTTWVNLGNIDGPTTDTTVTAETSFNIGTAFVGVTGKSMMLRLTLFPGDSGASSHGNSTGNRQVQVHWHDVTWDWAPTTRHTWSMTVLAVPYLVGSDGTRINRTGPQIMADLWSAKESGSFLKFQDVDLTWWLVKVNGLSQYEPKIDYKDLEGRRAEMTIVLQEFAELNGTGTAVVE